MRGDRMRVHVQDEREKKVVRQIEFGSDFSGRYASCLSSARHRMLPKRTRAILRSSRWKHVSIHSYFIFFTC